MNNKMITGAFFIDLRKAIDTVDHTLLNTNLIGFSNHVVDRFWSYLSSRSTVTSINNSTSDPKPVAVGVPQGGTLGPLLFLLYINDLPQCLNHCKSIMYTDNILLYHSAKTVTDLESKLNTDLESVSHWLNNNILNLNNDKTKFMIFTNKKQSQSNSDVPSPSKEKKIQRA